MSKYTLSIVNKNDYIDDFGDTQDAETIASVVKRPSWIQEANFLELVGYFGFRLKTDQDVFVCGEDDATPRRLEFVTNEGSFSIPLCFITKDKTNEVINQTVALIKGLSRKTRCVMKVGEQKKFVYFLRTKTEEPVAGQQAVSTGPGSRYSGKYFYTNDVGIIVPLNFGVDTERKGQPPVILGNEWAGCVGSQTKVQCPSPATVKARYFWLTTLFDAGSNTTGSQKHKVPYAVGQVGAGVKECAVKLANLGSAICLDYFGESDSRYHKTLDISLK